MSYTSTLRVQLGKPPLKGSREEQPKLSENGCKGLQHIDIFCGSAEKSKRRVLPGELHMKLEKNWERDVVKTAEDPEKVSEMDVTSGKMPCNLQVVKTSDKYLTVMFELFPQNGGELCVRRVKSPVPILTTALNATRRLVTDGPLPSVQEASEPESCPTATTTQTERVKVTTAKVWENREREGKRASTTAIESPHKKSILSTSRFASFSSEAVDSPSKEQISPKRKPHTSGDSLRILNGVSHVEVKKGEKAELRCSIQGTPPLAASWVRNKKPVVDGPRISVRTSETESCLLIRQLCEEDSGSYNLCVQDQTGSVQHQMSLAIVDEDPEYEEPVEYREVFMNTTDRVDDLYVKLEKLGMGKFGQVYKLQEKASGNIRAGKFSKGRLQKDIANARAEVELMNKLHHPRLVHCVAAFQEPGWVILVLEYIAGGELFERIVADDFEHTEITSIEYMSQILSGVGYMHQQSIVHLDLKPENIVCVSKINTKVKIIDFGLARKLEPGVPTKVLQGTAEFVAPEVIAYEPVGFTTDMWSLGVICYILLSGDSPFQGDNDTETLQNITSGTWEFDEETDAVISDSAKDFIRRLLQKNMKSRLTAEQAIGHPWIKDKAVSSPKTLSKEKMKKFLARQKWQKTGKAVLALKRMAMLSHRSDSNSSPNTDDDSESKKVFSFLQEQLQRPPIFSSLLKDQSEDCRKFCSFPLSH
ncbi:myosin light chain kinase, smooth muscle-like isoform X3 [Bufo gargarizans]|uniref:myosin light chain kinase, smooth muscle-like isoform X3 n=1 Tax=Bufo gargarizans TaxID=30331 RepID=UPI001CF3D1A6|nr:myosin light chain kinase, smooth muscle-like isoform X3 [Bufo gargarizans]